MVVAAAAAGLAAACQQEVTWCDVARVEFVVPSDQLLVVVVVDGRLLIVGLGNLQIGSLRLHLMAPDGDPRRNWGPVAAVVVVVVRCYIDDYDPMDLSWWPPAACRAGQSAAYLLLASFGALAAIATDGQARVAVVVAAAVGHNVAGSC